MATEEQQNVYHMKKLISVSMLLVMAFSLYAQQKDVTRFLGIPVDGSKREIIQKLKAKGFESTTNNPEILEGEFNGTDVYINVVTNNNTVWRIAVTDKNNISEANIKIRFNRLCYQFMKNPNYMTFGDYTISDEENISYQMTVNNKRYEAIFYQAPIIEDTIAIAMEVRKLLSEKYSEEELNNPTEEQRKEFTETSTKYVLDLITNKSVWFMISKSYGEYYITIFYDNEYNHANGEDL